MPWGELRTSSQRTRWDFSSRSSCLMLCSLFLCLGPAGAVPRVTDPFPWPSLGCRGRPCCGIPGQQKPPQEMWQAGPLDRLLHAVWGPLLLHALCYHVPYSSLTMFLGGSRRDRDSATAYRMGVELLSTLVGSGIQGQMVGSHHASMQQSCEVGNGTWTNSTSRLMASLENARWAYMTASLVLGSLYCVSCLVLFLGVKEQPGPFSPLGGTRVPFASSLRTLLGHRPYVRLLCGFLLASLAFQLAQGIFAFFCTHAAGLAGRFPHLVLIMLVVACLSIPFWQWFLVRFGKKTAVIVGLSVIIPALIVITVVTHNFLVFIFMVAMAGCSLAVLFLLPCRAIPIVLSPRSLPQSCKALVVPQPWHKCKVPTTSGSAIKLTPFRIQTGALGEEALTSAGLCRSMLPDAVDDFRLQNPACLNLEALFYSFYVFFNKFAGGLSLGISTMSLHFAGYRATDCTHNPRVILTLRILMGPLPIALLLLSIAVFCSYPIDEERRKHIRLEMEDFGRLQDQAESPPSEASQAHPSTQRE